MMKSKIPGVLTAALIAAGLLVINSCVFLGANNTPTPVLGNVTETATFLLPGTSSKTAETQEGGNEGIGTTGPEVTETLSPDLTSIGGDIPLLPLDMTKTAFTILIHGGGVSSSTPGKATPTAIPSSGLRTSTRTPTRGTQVFLTPTRTLTHSASWYYTSTLTRTATRNAATLTKIKYVTYLYATRTGRAQTNTAAMKTWSAGQTRTAAYSTTQAALSTLTRTSIAKTAAEQTIQAQVRTQVFYVTQTEAAKTAVYRVTQTAQYWPQQTDIAATVLPTYVLTPPPTPTPNPNPRVAYSGNLIDATYRPLLIKYITPSVGLWAFISGSYNTLLNDVSHDGYKLIFEMNNKLYIVYPKDTTSRVDLLPNQDTAGDDVNSQAAFSPDGEWIVFRKDSGGQYDLYIIRPDGSDLTRLTNDAGEEQYPDWSADGSTLVLSKSDDNKLYTLDVSIKPPASMPSSLPTPVSLSIDGTRAHFSPIGDQVVIEQSNVIKIASFSANPNSLTILSWVNPSGIMPRWSTDGLKILYVGIDDYIYQIVSSGTPSPTVISGTDGASNPIWMP